MVIRSITWKSAVLFPTERITPNCGDSPFFNLLFVIYLCCAKGDAAANNYGAPHLTKTWEKILGWIYIILLPIAMLGLVAAIAIPAYQDYVQRAKQAQIQMQQQQYPE